MHYYYAGASRAFHYLMQQPYRSLSSMPVCYLLIGINLLVFFIQQASPINLYWLALWSVGDSESIGLPPFMAWQLISYGFLHGDLSHLFFNMLGLYMFGLPLESLWGKHRFLQYYFSCLVGAGFVQLIVALCAGDIYPTIGASGAIFGLLLAYGLRFPNNIVMLLFPPIPMKAKYFVWIYGALELFFGVTGRLPGVAHFAHLGGMLFGFMLLWYWGWRPRR